MKVRYLTERPGKGGGKRYFWQPGAALRAAGWRVQRLPDDPAAAVRAAGQLNAELDRWRAGGGEGRPPAAAAGSSVADLIACYRASLAWQGLKPSTQRGYQQALQVIADALGDAPVRAVSRKVVRLFYEQRFRRAPAAANAQLRVLRLLLQFGVDDEWIAENPAAKPRMQGLAPRQAVWSEDDVAVFVATADRTGRPSIGTAVLLAFHLGQREGDILRLSWRAVADGVVRLRQGKTAQLVEVAIAPPLAARLAGLERHAGSVVVSEETGKPYVADTFRAVFARVRQVAAVSRPQIAGLQFLDLRRSLVVALGEASCTEAEIAAVTGHQIEGTRQILETYLPRNSAMAASAVSKLEQHRAKRRRQP